MTSKGTRTVNIKVFPNAGRDEVSEEKGVLKVRVSTPAVRGKANKIAIKLLAKHLGVKKSAIRIVRGERSREKVIEIRRSGNL